MQRHISSSREPIIVHLHTNATFGQAAIGQLRRQIAHRMALGRLHIVIRVTDDIGRLHKTGPQRALGILPSPIPNGSALQRQDHALVDIK